MSAPQYVPRSYSGGAAIAALQGGIGASDLSFTITVTTEWPTGSGGPFTITLDKGLVSEERVLCASLNPSTGVVTVATYGGWTGRGYDNTDAQGHLAGSGGGGPCLPTWSAAEAAEANAAVAAVMGGALLGSVGEILAVGPGNVPQWQSPSVAGAAPPGAIVAYAGAAVPTGWLLAAGQAVSRTTYAALFAAIGTGYGAGDGSTTFNLPNLFDRMPIGAGFSYGLGAAGGEATHVLTVAELASHGHGGEVTLHQHLGPSNTYQYMADVPGSSDNLPMDTGTWGVSFSSRTGDSTGHVHANAGGGAAHNNLPPYLGLYYIIKSS